MVHLPFGTPSLLPTSRPQFHCAPKASQGLSGLATDCALASVLPALRYRVLSPSESKAKLSAEKLVELFPAMVCGRDVASGDTGQALPAEFSFLPV